MRVPLACRHNLVLNWRLSSTYATVSLKLVAYTLQEVNWLAWMQKNRRRAVPRRRFTAWVASSSKWACSGRASPPEHRAASERPHAHPRRHRGNKRRRRRSERTDRAAASRKFTRPKTQVEQL